MWRTGTWTTWACPVWTSPSTTTSRPTCPQVTGKWGWWWGAAASDEQADALERILSGREGGPFGQLSQFYGEYLGMERAGVSLTDGEKPGCTVEGRTELSYEPLTGPEGGSTKIKNAMSRRRTAGDRVGAKTDVQV
ncbi:DUF1326 domain-containing protein [Streptomyces bobili]|uniref:DUF1326 domain-containing protein n=1 Tax=Streptomyces bobili TaxID=67280 RepID=UPI00339F8998